MKNLLFLTLIVAFSAVADESAKFISDFDVRTDIISDNYEAGQYLIYDCKEKHWTCVMETYFKECAEKREKDLLNIDEVYHSCAPIEKYPNKRSCFQRQLFLTSHNFGQRVCVKESWKEKNIEF